MRGRSGRGLAVRRLMLQRHAVTGRVRGGEGARVVRLGLVGGRRTLLLDDAGGTRMLEVVRCRGLLSVKRMMLFRRANKRQRPDLPRVTTTITTIDDECATRRFLMTERYTRRKKRRRAPWTARVTHEVPGTGSLASGTGQGIKARIRRIHHQEIRSYSQRRGDPGQGYR